MNFIIKKNSTFPKLEYGIPEYMFDKYQITDEMMDNSAITFSMFNVDNNTYKIANVIGTIRIGESGSEYRYYLVYNFKKMNTNTIGNYIGEFVIDFLSEDCELKLKLPIDDTINIQINDTITETTVY